MKRILFLIVITALIFSCSKKEIRSIKLKMFNYKVEYVKQLGSVIESFSTRYKGKYTIEMETIPYEAQLVLEARLRENTGWDIIMIPPYKSIVTNASANYLMDLTNEAVMTKIYDSVKPPVAYDNKIYAMPYGLNVYGVFYNKDIFNSNQVAAPENISELKGLINTFQTKKIVPFSICGKDEWVSGYVFFALVSSALGVDIDRWIETMNGGISSFNNPKINGVYEILDFYKANGGAGIKNIDYYTQINNFSAGKTAMMFQGLNEFNIMNTKNPNIKAGVFAFPTDDTKNSNLCVDVDFAFAISNNVDKEKKEGVIRFLEYLTNFETMELMNKGAKIVFAVKNTNASGINGDIKKYLDEGKIVNWAHKKIPAGVFEESKRQIKNYITGSTTKEEANKNLDKVWRINLENK